MATAKIAAVVEATATAEKKLEVFTSEVIHSHTTILTRTHTHSQQAKVKWCPNGIGECEIK